MIKTLLRVSVSFLFLGLFVYLIRNEIPTIVETIRGADKRFLIVAVMIFLAGTIGIAKRLQLVFEVHDLKLSIRDSWSLIFVGFFFNNFLPTAVGGDLVKAYCASRLIGQKMKAATCVLMDRFFGLLMFIAIPSVTVLFLINDLDPIVPRMVFGVLMVALFGTAFIFSKGVAGRFSFLVTGIKHLKFFQTLKALYEDAHVFRHHTRAIVAVCSLSFLWQLLMVATIYLFILSLGGHMRIIYLLLLVPLVNLMGMLPSVNGLGVREMGFLYFFKDSIGTDQATAIAILNLALLIILGAIGAVVYLMRPDFHFRFKEISKQQDNIG